MERQQQEDEAERDEEQGRGSRSAHHLHIMCGLWHFREFLLHAHHFREAHIIRTSSAHQFAQHINKAGMSSRSRLTSGERQEQQREHEEEQETELEQLLREQY